MPGKQTMTAEDNNEEAAESEPTSETSDSDEQGESDAKRDPDIEEGESALGSFEVDIVLEERSEEGEQSHRDEKEGAIEHHGEIDLSGDGKSTGDEEDCPFCLYMKSGACGESFADWEKCINEGEKTGQDIAEKCVRVTRLLTQCMRANADYYGPILEAEKAMAASVANGEGLDHASAQADRTYRQAVEVAAQNAVQEAEG